MNERQKNVCAYQRITHTWTEAHCCGHSYSSVSEHSTLWKASALINKQIQEIISDETTDGRISDPTIQIRSDFHYPGNPPLAGLHISYWIRSGLIMASTSVMQYADAACLLLLFDWYWVDSLCWSQLIKITQTWPELSFDVRRSRVYTKDALQKHANEDSINNRHTNEATGNWAAVY